MGFLAGIVNRTIFSNVQNSDKMISCHCQEIRQTSKVIRTSVYLGPNDYDNILNKMLSTRVSRVSTKSRMLY